MTRSDFGSITYVSPERLESGEIDTYSDFWAVGVLLYQMLAGLQPFRAPDTRRLELRIRSLQPPEPLGPSCPPASQAVVAKLLAGRPADRYGDARAIRDDLECARTGRVTQAEREGWPAGGMKQRAGDGGPRPSAPVWSSRENGASRVDRRQCAVTGEHHLSTVLPARDKVSAAPGPSLRRALLLVRVLRRRPG